MTMRRNARGFTLLELIIAIAVMIIAVAAATSLMIASVRLTRDVQGNAEAAERARTAMAELMDNTSRVMGAANGVHVLHSGVVEIDSPLFGYDGTTGAGTNKGAAINDGTTAVVGGGHSDDLWIVVPSRTVFGEPCQGASAGDLGAKVPISGASGVGAVLQVPCVQNLASFTQLLVTTQLGCGQPVLPALSPPNLPCDLASLITPITPLAGTTVDYSEKSTAGIPPDGSTFHPNDEVMGVTLIHYFIAPNPGDKYNGVMHPALFRTVGYLADDSASPRGGNRPFSDTSNTRVEMPDVEDMQIAWGLDSATAPTNNVASYTWQNGFGPIYFTGTARTVTLKALRLTLVARSHQILLREGSINPKALPLQSENHNSVTDPGAYWTTPDGYDRVVLTRVMPLPNMSPWNL